MTMNIENLIKEAQENGIAMFKNYRITRGDLLKSDLSIFGIEIEGNLRKEDWAVNDIMRNADIKGFTSLEDAIDYAIDDYNDYIIKFEDNEITKILKKYMRRYNKRNKIA